MTDAAPTRAQGLLGQGDYRLFWTSRFTAGLGFQAESVAIGWQVYGLARRTHDVDQSAFLVGLVGLATFLPLFLLALPAGEVADRHDRKSIFLVFMLVECAVAAGLALATRLDIASIPLILGAAALFGAARAFLQPANTALGPMLVPRELLPRAIAWNSLAGQTSSIAGSALGGVLVAISPALAYAAAAILYLVATAAALLIRTDTKPDIRVESRMALIKEGLAYVWRNRVVFGAISLDLFAVLLGGATALLPVFARDILHVGSGGFGILRAGPTIGAALVALVLASRPIRRRAGIIMFSGVAVFGAATIAFGLSNWLWLSVAALAVLGGADMLSVYVRQTLVQLVTPDPMRGRVAAVSTLFISTSNELGEFESGLVARFFGPIGSAIFGGFGALAVTGIWAKLFPALRSADRLE